MKKIELKDKRKAGIILSAIVLTITIATTGGVRIYKKSVVKAADNENQLQTEDITKQDLEKSLSINGTIAALESQSVTSELSGVKVKSIKVRVGDHVKKGDVVAELDTSTIEKALKQAEDSLEIAKQKDALEMATAKRNYDTAVEQARIQQERAQREVDRAQQEYEKSVNASGTADGLYASAQENVDNKTGEANYAQGTYDEASGNAKNTAEKYERKQEKLEDAQKRLTEAERVKTELDGMQEDQVENLNAQKEEAQRELDDARAAVEKAEKEVRKAKHENEKAQSALESNQNALSDAKSNLADAKADQANAEADAKSKKEGIDGAQDSVTKAKDSQQDIIRDGEKSLADAKDSIKSTELGQSSSNISLQQEIEKCKQQIASATLIAPCDGLVTSVGIKEGAIYDNGKEIMNIQNDKGYKVNATVDQFDICDVKEGMPVKIKTDSMGDELLEGTVSFVSPIPGGEASGTEQSSGTASSSNDYPIEVSIKNKTDRLRIGMTAKITIVQQEKKDALVVPDSVIQQSDDGKNYIEVVTGESTTEENAGGENPVPKTEKIDVTYGIKTDYYVEINGKGIKEGMKVVIPTTDYSEDTLE
ncbi:HlyD family efflux transporter periplasmic adaptor subunit [Butyrivibrio sp. AE3004]|uniref:HlyD family efflux transporter periplasmic adaptor subunit n=1 Tax=Butyrivibrio sp. AE3004 TaxID=1506994 RepID=UPI000494CCDF|nr:HlyD family efflux transporter periplasmic adaptor subunit [Butyrivibrio sp. AE3004]